MFHLPPNLYSMSEEVKQEACNAFNNRHVPIFYNHEIVYIKPLIEPKINIKQRELNKIKRNIHPSFARDLFY
jgi:hypothetical protein